MPICHMLISLGLEPGEAYDIFLPHDLLAALQASLDLSVLFADACGLLTQHTGKGWSFPALVREEMAEPAGIELLE